MIEYIRGEIVELTPTLLILDCNGLGYSINISLYTSSLIGNKKNIQIYIHEIIREDTYALYGFADKIERECFRLLTSVSGVGPSTARVILSSLTPTDLANAVAEENAKILTLVKGIGQKTGQRIIIDLKNKMPSAEGTSSSATPTTIQTGKTGEEAIAAMVMLGYTKGAATKAIHAVMKKQPNLKVEQVIKAALKVV